MRIWRVKFDDCVTIFFQWKLADNFIVKLIFIKLNLKRNKIEDFPLRKWENCVRKRIFHPQNYKNRGDWLVLEEKNFYKTQWRLLCMCVCVRASFAFSLINFHPPSHSFWECVVMAWHDCEIWLRMLCDVYVVMKREILESEWVVDVKNRNHGWISNINGNHNQIYYWQCSVEREFPTNKLSHSFNGEVYIFLSL